ADLAGNPAMRRSMRSALRGIRDLERLAVKVASGRCSPRDLLALRASLDVVPTLEEVLAEASARLLDQLRAGLDSIPDLGVLIDTAIDPEAPPAVADGGVIRAGYDVELDDLRSARDGAVEWISRLQA